MLKYSFVNGSNITNTNLNVIYGTISLLNFFTSSCLNEPPYVEKNKPDINTNNGIRANANMCLKCSGSERLQCPITTSNITIPFIRSIYSMRCFSAIMLKNDATNTFGTAKKQ